MTQGIVFPRLIVEDGLHRLAGAPLQIGEISVGANAANAVVISDLSAPTAFRLRWNGRSISLMAVESDASINGRVLRRGGRRDLKRSSTFTCGGVAFRIEWPVTPRSAAPTPGWARRGFAAGVACTVALGATATLLAAPSTPMSLHVADTSRDAMASGSAGVGSNAKMDSVAAPAKPAFDDLALLGGLSRQLASSGLDGISVDMQPDGGVAASGRIVPAKAEAWHAAARWFDTAARGRAVLVDHVEVSAAAASLQIQAVYTGRTPYVIDGEGQKLFVGASLPDGAVIQKIESQRVLVKRGDQIVAVRF